MTLTGSREICDILGMADSLAKPLESDKSAAKAEPAVRAIAMPADTNSHGDIWLLCQMDLAGGTIATRRACGRVVTIAITGMEFHRPVMVGDEVSCFCNIERVGNTSITVKIESWVRRGLGTEQIKVTEGIFTYVAVDADGRPQPVPTQDASSKAQPAR